MTVSTAILLDPLWCLVEFCCVYCCYSFYEYIYLCSDLTGSGNTARNQAFVMKLWLQGAGAATLRSCPCQFISSVWTQLQMLQSKNFPRVSCSLQCSHLGSQSTLSPGASTGRPRWASVWSCHRGLHSCTVAAGAVRVCRGVWFMGALRGDAMAQRSFATHSHTRFSQLYMTKGVARAYSVSL